MNRTPRMFTQDWVAENFPNAEWLGQGTYGEAWKVRYEGAPATLKITGSNAEQFCVENIRSIQNLNDAEWPFPFIYNTGYLEPPLTYNYEWYEEIDQFGPDFDGHFFYIREYAEPSLNQFNDQEYGATHFGLPKLQQEIIDAALAIYDQYGLIMIDARSTNWGYVEREGQSLLVPMDLACGTEEHWWPETGDPEDQLNEVPFEPPSWLDR